MRVTVFAPYAAWRPHFETDLEIVQDHLDRGDEVTVLSCPGHLPACDSNPRGEARPCVKCLGRRQHGLSLLDGKVTLKTLPPYTNEGLPTLQTRFASVDELTAYHVGNFDIGWAVLSTLVSLRRDPIIDTVAQADEIERLIEASEHTYRSLVEYLAQGNTDVLYVFNGRFTLVRAALRASQNQGVPCFAHERGRDHHHYELYADSMPHDRDLIDRRIRQQWRESDTNAINRESKARRWFEDRARGISQTWKSFITDQSASLLPEDWDATKRNIVVFPSSEDEFVAIGDNWRYPFYETQLEGIQRLIDSLSDQSHDFHIYVRIHPNLTNVDNEQTRGLAALDAPFVTVVPPDSAISTYALLRRCEKAISFGSTIGIEATYWGVPSILLGPAFYRNLAGTYNPRSHDEFLQLLSRDLPPLERTPALMYGYYQATFGRPYRYYASSDLMRGTFRGSRVRQTMLSWLKSESVKLADVLRRLLPVFGKSPSTSDHDTLSGTSRSESKTPEYPPAVQHDTPPARKAG